jgi:hypothetical protein
VIEKIWKKELLYKKRKGFKFNENNNNKFRKNSSIKDNLTSIASFMIL